MPDAEREGRPGGAHEDRAPTGRLPAPAEVADQLAWVLENRSFLLSGATLTLAGGALP